MNRRCPVCNSTKSTEQIAPEVEVSELSIEEHWSGFLAEKTFFPYHRCECGFLFCPSYPDDKVLAKLYGSMSDNEHSGNPKLERATKTGYARQIIQFSKRRNYKRVLELGADNGSLARILNETLMIDEYHCVEPNKMVHDQLKQIPNVFVHDTLEKALQSKKCFDAVVAVHVLDHVPDLNSILTKLCCAIRGGGIFYCVVHNERSLLARVFGKRWPAYCLQHPHLFNSANLPNILEKKHYKNLKIYRTRNYFSLGYLIRHLFLAVFKAEVVFPNMFNISVKLGNIALIGVKKDD